MDIIDRINLVLFKRGETGAELCRAIGLSNSIYSQWNTRKSKPSKKTLHKIASYFDVSLEYLLYGKEEQKERPSENGELDEYLDMLRERPGLRALLKVHKGSTDEEIEANVRFIEELRNKHD